MTMGNQAQQNSSDPFSAETFAPASESQWRALVEGVLKGKPFETLVGATADDIAIQPLYPRFAGERRGAIGSGHGWDIVARIDHRDPRDANAAARIALENGATGLGLVFAEGVGAYGFGIAAHDPSSLDVLLADIQFDAGVPVTVDAGNAAADVAAGIAASLARRRTNPGATEIRFGLDPLGAATVRGLVREPWSTEARRFASACLDLAAQGFKGPLCLADGRVVHNAGGSEAQELAYVIGCGLAYLRALDASGLSLDAADRLIGFRLSADADQFVTMAKFRAMRLLWALVQESCGLAPWRIALDAETAWRMMTRKDPWVNVLRTTLALAGAGLAGADAVTVLPHTQAIGLPDDFARRLARNAQLVLLRESNLDKVDDPAAGSGGIEALTDGLTEKAWALFQSLEGRGGIATALEDGSFQAEVLRIRGKREAAVASRRDVFIGTSLFPLLDEKSPEVLEPTPPPDLVQAGAAKLMPLPAVRLAEPFERLRAIADGHAARLGQRPRVFLATLGARNDFAARADFAEALFGAGGFVATARDAAFDGQDALLDAFDRAHAKIACLCGPDAAYDSQALALVTALRDRGATGIFIAGKPREDETRLRQAGVSRYIFLGCDAVAALEAAHAAL